MALDTTVGGADTDSYNTVAEYHDYVTKFYNKDLSGNDVAKDEANLRRAMQVLDWSWAWKGYRTDLTQNASFPRTISEKVDGTDVPTDAVPKNIKQAQMELAYLLDQGVDLTPTIEGGTVRSESVGAGPAKVSTEFDQIMEVPKVTRVNNLIRAYHYGEASSLESNSEVIRG